MQPEENHKNKVAELEAEGLKMKQRIGELQKNVDSLKLEKISNITTMDAIFQATQECTDEAMQELENEATAMEKALRSSNQEMEILIKERTGIHERVQGFKAAYDREMKTREAEKERMVSEHQRDIKYHKTTLKYWLKNLPLIRSQSQKRLARGNRLATELADAKKECERRKHELVAVQAESSVLKKKDLQSAADLKQQIALREEETASKKESIKVINEMTTEKERLVQKNTALVINKNKLRIKCDKLNKMLLCREDQLEKAQKYARELEQEQHLQRLNKRKGLKKLMCCKRN